jgi:hypothetical protein
MGFGLPHHLGPLSLDLIVALYLAGIFLASLWCSLRLQRHDTQQGGGLAQPTDPFFRSPFDRVDAWAVLIALTALGLRLVLLPHVPISADEAVNLEPHFFTRWFSGWESYWNPPLFRLLIHLKPVHRPTSLWLMRTPSAVFGALTVFVLFRLIRTRCSAQHPGSALLGAALLAVFPLHVEYSLLERSYALVCLLLVCNQLWFEQCLSGRSARWWLYSLFSTLAVLTHYLSLLYLLGHLLAVRLRQPKKTKLVATALVFPLATFLPFALKIVSQPQLALNAAAQPDIAYRHAVLAQTAKLLSTTGGGGLLLWTLIVYRRRKHSAIAPASCSEKSTQTILWPLLCGALGGLLLGTTGRKYFLPIVPLGLAGLAPLLSETWFAAGWTKKTACVVAGILFLLFPAFSASARLTHTGTRDFVRSYRLACLQMALPNAVAIYPPSVFARAAYTLTQRRDIWTHACGRPTLHRVLKTKNGWVFALSGSAPAHNLKSLVSRLGGLDILLLQPRRFATNTSKARFRTLERWLLRAASRGQCNRIVSAGKDTPKQTPPGENDLRRHRAFRCHAKTQPPPTRRDYCRALRLFALQN